MFLEHQDSPGGEVGRGEHQDSQGDMMDQAEHQDSQGDEKDRDEQMLRTSGSTEGRAEQSDRESTEDALMKGQAEQLRQRDEDDPYVMAWVAWKERYEIERKKIRKAGKKEKAGK